MSNVIVDKNKIDILANAISLKSGEPITMTLDEMVEAVDSIETDGGITPIGNINITQSGVTDVTNYATATVPEADITKAETLVDNIYVSVNSSGLVDASYNNQISIDPITNSGWLEEGTRTIPVYIGLEGTYQLPTQSATTITPTESTQTAVTAGKYTTGAVTVGAISSTYVGTGITRRSSSDLTASGATVTVPAGYYSAQASKVVASGTAGTPTATKGTVSNHSVSVTPSVTNTTGYISGSTINGTAITVSASELVSGSETKTENGTYDVTSLAELVVNVPTGSIINNQNKSVTPSESQQSVTADSGYTGLGIVTVGAISTTYVGSGITRRSSTDLTVSGATISVPAGYYAEAVSKEIASGTKGTLSLERDKTDTAFTITFSYPNATEGYYTQSSMRQYVMDALTIQNETVTPSTSTQVVNVRGNAYYLNSVTVEAMPSGSATAPASISGTAASVSTGTNTLTLTKTVSVTPTVSAGYISAGTAGNASVSLTASVTTKAAATITPTTTNQTIAAGTYLTGTQTIAGDADLVASNIISTANIFGVQGSVVVQSYYTGSSAPASSLGQNGDIYLQE